MRPPAPRDLIRFGNFEADMQSGELRKNGIRLHLQPQPFQILSMLLRSPGQVVTREDMRDAVWPAASFGDFDHAVNKALNKIRTALGDACEPPKYIETIPRRGYRFIADVQAPEPRMALVAVLPFRERSESEAGDYFGEGMAEEILNALASIGCMRVVARTSAFQFRTEDAVARAREQLGITAAVTGTIRRAGTRIRVLADLVDASTQEQLWSECYNRELADVFAVQEEIAGSIARALHVKLCPSVRPGAVQPPTRNVDAWDAYLKGRYHLSRLMPAEVQEAIRQLKLSVEKDPEFAPAYAALAEAYGHFAANAQQNRAAIFNLARTALDTALLLNPNLPEARALSAISQVFRYNWAAAEREFSTALELAPRSPSVLTRRARWFLTPQGRTDEALADVDLALESDPLSNTVIMARALIFWFGHQYGKCYEECERMLSLDPNYVFAHLCKASIKLITGRAGEGVAVIEQLTEESGRNPVFLTFLATAYAKTGDRGRALEILRDLGEGDDCTSPFYYLAHVYAALEDADRTVECLERSVMEHDPNIVFLAVQPQLDCIRRHPRYGALLNSIGLGHMAGRPVVYRASSPA